MPLSSLTELPANLLSLVDKNESLAVFLDGKFAAQFSTVKAHNADIIVPANTSAQIHMLYIHGAGPGSESNQQVTVSEGASAVVTETHVNLDGAKFSSSANTQITVKAGGNLQLQRLCRLGDAGELNSRSNVKAYRDAQLVLTQLTLGGAKIRNELTAELLDSGANAKLLGLSLGKAKQHIDNTTFVRHVIGHTGSQQVYKNLLAGQSRIDFNGRLVIEEDAQKSDAAQLNQNLMIGERAEANTTPQLEVFADDVKAAHGASVGQMDEEQIFYLMSRGLSRAMAVRFLAEGFLQDIVERMPMNQQQKGRALLANAFHDFLEADL